MKKFLILLTVIFFAIFSLHPVFAEDNKCSNIDALNDLNDIGSCLSNLTSSLELSKNATKPLEGQLNSLKIQLAQIQNKLAILSVNIVQKEKDIAIRTDKLVIQQSLLSQRVRSYYIRSYMASPLTVIFSSVGSGDLLRELSYRQAATREDQNVISQVTADMLDIITQKDKLEKDKKALAAMQIEVDKNAAFIGGEVKKAKDYQATLSKQIASLSAKQQQIINARLGSLNLPTSLGAGPLICTDDRNVNPGFSPAFAFFTFGIPHRVGLNQYGALGRARAGQGYQDILRAYFDNINFEKKGNVTIKVKGYGDMPLETYLLGIYEMPGDWPMDALKAQVVAARSYALAYTDNGAKEICTTQDCQVYKGGNKGGNWEAAVKATEGEVLTSGGQIVTAWYSSTDGGYTFRNEEVWGGSHRSWTKRVRDTTGDVSSFEQLREKSYDRDSPCLYSAQGWRRDYGKSAWLKAEEVADIVNVILLVRKDASKACFVFQPDKPAPSPDKDCTQTDNWSPDRVKQELGGSAISTVNSANITGIDWGSGQTTQVIINGITFSGEEFKNYFNLRAPANISIVGPLFNIEKR